MKVRVLSHRPHEPQLTSGVVYDLHDGEHLVRSGEAEKVPVGTAAKADPRPQPEKPAAAPKAKAEKPAAKPAAPAKPAARKAVTRKR